MSMVSIYSTKISPAEVAEDLANQAKEKLEGKVAKLVIFFATSTLNSSETGSAMKAAFGSADVFGCTTAGEIANGKMLKNSVVAMIFDENSVEDVVVGVVENLSGGNNVESVFAEFEKCYGNLRGLDFRKYAGMILADGMSGAEERLMEKIGDLTDITFIGGSAGDDMKFEKTYVFANGKTYSDAAVLAMVKFSTEFDVIKTQSFEISEKHLNPTKVDEIKREVLEFNEKPAVEAYAEAVGVPTEKIQGEFMSHPVGLMVGREEPYVRSPQQVEGNSIKFFCKVKEGADLRILNSTDIVETTKKALQEKKKEMGNISGIINFNCILRTLELERKGQVEEYGKIFADIPTIGFSTYGEEYIGHINQTATMLVFK